MNLRNESQRPMFPATLLNWLFFNQLIPFIFHAVTIRIQKISNLYREQKTYVNYLTFVHKNFFTLLKTHFHTPLRQILLRTINNK